MIPATDGRRNGAGTDPPAEMPAALFERSMGPGPERGAGGAWFAEGPRDEPRARVGRVPGMAAGCPRCHARRGACDARGRTWRHLDIRRYETVARCAAPRADCPEDGVLTAPMPRGVRPNSRFTAPSGAQVPVMALSGMTATQVARQVRESDSRVRAILPGAVGEAPASADCPGVRWVGIDGTARRRGQNYISTMVEVCQDFGHYAARKSLPSSILLLKSAVTSAGCLYPIDGCGRRRL